MFVVDTNILVYAADEESPFHRPCYDLLDGWRKQPSAWYVTWGILYEFLRVVTPTHGCSVRRGEQARLGAL